MSVFSETAKNTMLDALSVTHLQLHSADPGSNGTDNQVGSAETGTFGSASGGERALSSNVEFTGLTGNQTVTWFSIWDGDPAGTGVFKGKGEITTGDTEANADGEFTLTTGTTLNLNDPV